MTARRFGNLLWSTYFSQTSTCMKGIGEIITSLEIPLQATASFSSHCVYPRRGTVSPLNQQLQPVSVLMSLPLSQCTLCMWGRGHRRYPCATGQVWRSEDSRLQKGSVMVVFLVVNLATSGMKYKPEMQGSPVRDYFCLVLSG